MSDTTPGPKPRLRWYQYRLWHFFVLVTVVAIPCAWLAWNRAKTERQTRELCAYREFIESEYKEQIVLIEHVMADEPTIMDEFFFEGAVKDIQESLSPPEIYTAHWSHDGHHGIAALKRAPAGYKYGTTISSHDPEHLHRLYYGVTDDNRKLLVYEGIVPSGKDMQVYSLGFTLDDIDEKMKSN